VGNEMNNGEEVDEEDLDFYFFCASANRYCRRKFYLMN